MNLPTRHAVLVDRLLPDGHWVVTNSCSEDIPIGAVFRLAVARRGFVQPDGIYRVIESGEPVALCAKLASVNVFRRDVQAIPKGYSAAIGLSGTGDERLRALVALRREGWAVELSSSYEQCGETGSLSARSRSQHRSGGRHGSNCNHRRAEDVTEYPDRMKAVCPRCHGTLQFSEAGGLFEIRCSSCDWKEEGTVSYSWSEMPGAERMPVMAAKAPAPVPAATLKCMRDIFIEAQRLRLSELAVQLSSEGGLVVGTLAAYRMSEVAARLAPTGVQLVRMPHEDDDR